MTMCRKSILPLQQPPSSPALFGGRSSQTAQADGGATTETAAPAAGARVLPTDPPLTVVKGTALRGRLLERERNLHRNSQTDRCRRETCGRLPLGKPCRTAEFLVSAGSGAERAI